MSKYEGGRNDRCNCGNTAAGCATGMRGAMSGQSCFWFSQGCFIGCMSCTGTDIQPHGMAHPVHSVCNASTPNQPAGSTSQPTLPKRCWSMHRGVDEFSYNDTYRYHPWRAPGSAPVSDPCGTAGGTSDRFRGAGHATFSPTNVSGAAGGSGTIRQGDLGSKVLARGPSGATWKLGSAVEVSWALRYNHGGGYQYRLCPASENLTEACFMRNPLDFVRDKQALVWKNGTRLPVPGAEGEHGVYIDEGIIPVGSTWARNPIPVIAGYNAGCSGPNVTQGTLDSRGFPCLQFAPPCAADRGWSTTPGSDDATDLMGKCSGNWLDGVVADEVLIPSGLTPGAYVLGFRWDCEETSQVWSSCADVTLVA